MKHVLLCDTCQSPISGEATEHQIISGTATPLDWGTARIVRRSNALWLYLCEPCNSWVVEAIHTLREARTA